jgi:ferredoxin-NADP reductase
VQKTDNPPAAWLHRPESDILGKELGIRVGGSFIWDDKEWECGKGCKRVVFIAGGVGINPFMSMLSHISEVATERKLGFEIKFLYSARDPGPARNAEEILFLPRLISIFSSLGNSDALELFLTPSASELKDGEKGRNVKDEGGISNGDRLAVLGGPGGEILYRRRRVRQKDIERVIGTKEEREGTLVYVCAGREMTDWIVEFLEGLEGMRGKEAGRVRCERWW